MKVLVVALMLFVLKEAEAHALPDAAEDIPTSQENTLVSVPAHGQIHLQNLSAIFKQLAQNMTSLTREIQERMQTFQTSFSNQTAKMKEHLASLLQEVQRPNEGISKLSIPSITQQLEMLKRNFSQLQMNIRPIQINQTSSERMQQEISEVFVPLFQFFQGTVTEGIENLRKAMAPKVHEIKKLVALAESTKAPLKEQ